MVSLGYAQIRVLGSQAAAFLLESRGPGLRQALQAPRPRTSHVAHLSRIPLISKTRSVITPTSWGRHEDETERGNVQAHTKQGSVQTHLVAPSWNHLPKHIWRDCEMRKAPAVTWGRCLS